MKDTEQLKNETEILTKKQYKSILIKMWIMLIATGIVCLIGGSLIIFADDVSVNHINQIAISGVAIFIIGCALFLFVFVYSSFKYMPKLYLYRYFKKYPQDVKSTLEIKDDLSE